MDNRPRILAEKGSGCPDTGMTSPSARHPERDRAALAVRDSALVFFREFLREPSKIGSIIPTSSTVVAAILDQVDWARTSLFVEYGPGLGTFTRAILDRLPDHARLIAIDTNDHFIHHLRDSIGDERFTATLGSAVDVQDIIDRHGFAAADYILSGLPFSTLPAGVGQQIARATHDALQPDGTFLVYQYSRFVLRFLQPQFPVIRQQFCWKNIPPCRLFFAGKGAV